jgi:C4-dicarboxylate-binding protein DctP
VTYGVHHFHKFHTLTSHFCVSRPVFLNRAAFDAWPSDLQEAMREAVQEAVAFQRRLAIEEHESARVEIERAGCEIVNLNAREHEAFISAVQPMLKDARASYGEEMFAMLR